MLAMSELAKHSIATGTAFKPVLTQFLLVVRTSFIFVDILSTLVRVELYNLFVGVKLRRTESLLTGNKGWYKVLRNFCRCE